MRLQLHMHVQGTPVKFRDGPAAVTDVMGGFPIRYCIFFQPLLTSFYTHNASEAVPREGMQWKHRESEDLPHSGCDGTFLGEVRAES